MSESEKAPESPFVSLGDDGALVTIDLAAAPESGGAAFGRIVGGLVLFVVCGLLAIGSVVLYVGGAFVLGFADWADFLGDAILFVGAILLGLSILGFELMRRGRRKRGQALSAALETTARILGDDDSSGVASVDDYNPNRISPKTQQPPTLL
jgi:hypothetical protein